MLLDKLNAKQKEAAQQIQGPLLILAGAGSGKTSTMTHRIAYMIQQGIDPYNILAVTFTNKAAKEMNQRITSLVGDLDSLWVMTFHAFCLRILRYNPERLGYKNNFVVYDTSDQKALIKSISKELNLNEKEFTPAYLISAISKIKESGGQVDEGITLKQKVVNQVYRKYQTQLKANNGMDFDDILYNAVRLLKENKDLLEKYQNRFKYVMVDEYQDTNKIQYQLIKLLASHRNLCVVGDDDQCIYQWRGADIRNILDFEKDFPEAKVIKLEQNYRSVGNIIKAAHSVIENNVDRKGKKLWTDKEDGHKLTYHRADDDKDEAAFAAGQISFWNRKGYKYSDFAILYRTNAQSRLFEEALTRYHIPYRVLAGLRYYDRKEIKDMMSYMRLLINPDDDLSFRRIINEPKRGIGPKTVDKIQQYAQATGQSMVEVLSDGQIVSALPAKAGQRALALWEALEYCGQALAHLPIEDVYDNLLVRTGYLPALEEQDTDEARGRIENLMEFKSVIAEYEKTAQEPTLADFLENLTLMAEVDNHDENQDAVVLMTMHSSKGLEFPVVFIPGMEDGLFPSSRSFDKQDDMEQERRLCYVAMTRAMEKLYLTSATVRTMYGRTDYTKESMFLKEIDPKYMDGDGVFRPRDRQQMASGTYGPKVETGGFVEKGSGARGNDFLAYAKKQVKATAAKGDLDLKAGDRVSHPKFGAGTVSSIAGKTMVVDFDQEGPKKMALGLAPVTKI